PFCPPTTTSLPGPTASTPCEKAGLRCIEAGFRCPKAMVSPLAAPHRLLELPQRPEVVGGMAVARQRTVRLAKVAPVLLGRGVGEQLVAAAPKLGAELVPLGRRHRPHGPALVPAPAGLPREVPVRQVDRPAQVVGVRGERGPVHLTRGLLGGHVGERPVHAALAAARGDPGGLAFRHALEELPVPRHERLAETPRERVLLPTTGGSRHAYLPAWEASG